MTTAVDVSFVTSGHDVADARLHRLVGECLRQGLSVEVLGLGDLRDGPDGARIRTWPRPGMVRRAGLGLRMAAAAQGAGLVALDPDSLLAARLVGALRRRPVVADVHEDYLRLLEDRPWARGIGGVISRVVAHTANRLAASCALTLVADDHVPPLRARRRIVVRNEPVPGLLGQPGQPDRSPRAVYVGDVRASRGLWDMLDAVAAAPGWALDIVGPVSAADRAEVDRRTRSPELTQRVRLHGRQPPARAWRIARGAWVGFALLADTPAFRDAVPSKLSEYLTVGIVPLVSPRPRSAALVEEAGAGFVAESPAAASAVLNELAAEPATHAAHRAAALAWSARHRAEESPYVAAARAMTEVVR